MTEPLLIAIISAGLATFINCIFQIVNKIIDLKQTKATTEEKRAGAYREKKEQVYIAALDRLLQIRRGFEFTSDAVPRNKRLQEMVNKQNQDFVKIAPKLRLYASDNIFNQYQRLASWGKFAYASSQGPRLLEDSKRAYDLQITLLARRMQDDLGYRKYNQVQDTIQCPDCGIIHDIVGKCPKCGMTYEQWQKRIEEIFNQVQKDSTCENDKNIEDEV